MKEKFQSRLLYGDLNVACVFQDGTKRMWKDRKERVVARIVEVVTAYSKMGYRLTLRQLHYQFVSRNWTVNHDTAYKKLGKILDDCRYAGVVDWDAIVDRGRQISLDYSVRDTNHALENTIRHYKLDRMQEQETYLELWTEKDALSEIMERSSSKYHIPLAINKGYTSSSAVYTAYNRVTDRILSGQDVTILYFGDHDPSGLDMVRDIRERLNFMLDKGQHRGNDLSEMLTIKPIGLTMQQIKRFKLPPNPTKMTDARAAAYVKQFGKTCWEVDALNPETLTEIIESNVEAIIDIDQYNKVIAREKKDKSKLRKFIDKK